MAVKNIVGKSLYAALFNQMLPLLLIAWAVISERNIGLPVIDSPVLGVLLTAAGVVLVAMGMFGIIKWGKGLPMNAYPPEKFVTRGIFRLIPHPVYSGAVISVGGVSILFHSAAGFWLVTPFLALGCIALVLGYERDDMQKRFGTVRQKCLVSFPDNTDERAGLWDFISAYVIVFLTWFVLYELVCLMGTNARSVSSFTSFEQSLPVIEWTELFYILTYPFILLLPLTLRYKKELREFIFTGVAATLIGIFLQLAFPFIAPPRDFAASGIWGSLIKFERSIDSAAAAFPSFHVIWAFTGAYFYSRRFGKKIIWYSAAILISASCFTTGMHSLADILAGFITFLFVINIRTIASAGLKLSAKIANSWHEWDFGKIRILNHGFYVGAGAAIGYLIISSLSGEKYFFTAFLISVFIVVCAGLWAQAIEGSSKLSRPYGFYGGLTGALAGIVLISPLTGLQPGILFGAFAVAAPWIQISGRFRCLVQGCCHGKEINNEYGIKFHHPRSRVTRLAGLADRPLHATQSYSIISNAVSGILLIRLWYENVSPEFIAGIYLMFNGLARFVEESYRGEPQTPIAGGLRLYQWLALASFALGAYMTTVVSTAVKPEIIFSAGQLVYAASIGLLTFFAMGVDFPLSNKRFARLA